MKDEGRKCGYSSPGGSSNSFTSGTELPMMPCTSPYIPDMFRIIPQHRGKSDGGGRIHDPDPLPVAEAADAVGQDRGDNHCQVSFGLLLGVSRFLDPGVTPVLGSLKFPVVLHPPPDQVGDAPGGPHGFVLRDFLRREQSALRFRRRVSKGSGGEGEG